MVEIADPICPEFIVLERVEKPRNLLLRKKPGKSPDFPSNCPIEIKARNKPGPVFLIWLGGYFLRF